MAKSKKIKVFQYTKVLTIGFAFLGLVLGVLYSFGGLIIDALVSLEWINSNETPGLSYGTILAFGALVGIPAIGAAFGFITGIIGAFLYNFTLKIMKK
jgi:hypothetical protein